MSILSWHHLKLQENGKKHLENLNYMPLRSLTRRSPHPLCDFRSFHSCKDTLPFSISITNSFLMIDGSIHNPARVEQMFQLILFGHSHDNAFISSCSHIYYKRTIQRTIFLYCIQRGDMSVISLGGHCKTLEVQ